MNWLASLVLAGGMDLGQAPAAAPAAAPAPAPVILESAPIVESRIGDVWRSTSNGFLIGDTEFPRFIYPVSNPVFSKDPRATTHVRGLFIQNSIPGQHVLGGGDFQAVGAQVNIALNERLTIIADKDGYAWINPGKAKQQSGFLNLGAGLKYALVRDVENQFILSGGVMYELPTGERDAFSGHGDGAFAFFLTGGKEFAEKFHVLNTTGYYLPVDSNQNSAFFYTSLHLDYQVNCWLYPLAELNWFHYTAGGNRGLPAALGEGDGLINLGTSGVNGNDLVTIALGARAVLSQHLSIGAAWETPISNRQDLMQNRFLLDLILRY